MKYLVSVYNSELVALFVLTKTPGMSALVPLRKRSKKISLSVGNCRSGRTGNIKRPSSRWNEIISGCLIRGESSDNVDDYRSSESKPLECNILVIGRCPACSLTVMYQ